MAAVSGKSMTVSVQRVDPARDYANSPGTNSLATHQCAAAKIGSDRDQGETVAFMMRP
jgi:hypothetical protein